MHRTLGIDLGTTNSVMAWIKDGEPEVIAATPQESGTPSVVGLSGDGALLVGREALNWLERDATRVIATVKRLMGRQFQDPKVKQTILRMGQDGGPAITEGPDGGVLIRLGDHDYTPVQISAIILRRLKRDAEERVGTAFTRAVITAPAYFGERQIAATREAGRLAGFHVVRVLMEPTSAALAHGLGRAKDADQATVLVYDLGGGTFDVSILTLMPGFVDVLGVGGDNLLGGTDFDSSLTDHLKELLDLRSPGHEPLPGDDAKIRKSAEHAKIQLSSASATEVIVSPLGASGAVLSETVDRKHFESLIAERIEETVNLTRRTVTEASLLLEDIDQVLLVGGSSAIPLVAERLAELFGHEKLRMDEDPMTCVAFGAAIQSALIDTLDCPNCLASCPLDADTCSDCATPLVGTPTIECPTCHVPAPENTGSCPVCASDLAALSAQRPAPPSRSVCGECGEENAPEALECGLCEAELRDSGGLKCPNCALVNQPGLTLCSYCDAELPVAAPSDVTPRPIGVRTSDGSLVILVEAGTRYPTEQPLRHDFHVTADPGDMLEIALHEGDLQPAARNDLCGVSMYELPEGTTGTKALTIAVHLDRDRSIQLETRLDGASFTQAVFRRNPLPPEFRRRARETHGRFQTFLAEWRHELTQAESAVLTETATALDQIVRGEAPGRSLDTLLEDADDLLQRQQSVRWATALAYRYPHHVAELMPPEDLEVMRRHRSALKAMREAADFDRGHKIAEEVLSIRRRLGEDLYRVMSALAFASHNGVNAALQQRIQQAGEGLTEAARQGDLARVDAAKSRITDLYRDMLREQAEFQARERKTVRPEKSAR
ncbi:Hsp70 family protein [Streptomyces scopuliridis]|uniref:Hsp70 family protein n=1 Tax=Streptomyces scopuliridis TaxID=452529 RepID=A0ACD4ZT51_9ACTN|nr:Hsp70 family protein [Streptomyces scopuliridis]WSC00987.1 Hsp70 family protein [Streptomyces scopuliridis]WSC05403.1 Hsp70 family protein [Streptomyces scopuliridis]